MMMKVLDPRVDDDAALRAKAELATPRIVKLLTQRSGERGTTAVSAN